MLLHCTKRLAEKLPYDHFRNAVTTASQGERTPPGSGMSLFKEIDADPLACFFG